MLRLGHEAVVPEDVAMSLCKKPPRARGMRTFEEMVERADIRMTCSELPCADLRPHFGCLNSGPLVEEAGKITQPEAIPFLSHVLRDLYCRRSFSVPPVENALVRTTTRLDISFLAHIVDECQVDEASIVRLIGKAAVPIVCNLYRWRYANFHD